MGDRKSVKKLTAMQEKISCPQKKFFNQKKEICT